MAWLATRLGCRLWAASSVRRCSSGPPALRVYRLPTRGILRVTGAESADFLQGLVTNDMRHFEDGARCLYAMMLNTKGRVLFDLLIYRNDSEEPGFLVEADRVHLGKLQSLLKIYRVRRKIDVDDISSTSSVVAVREATPDAQVAPGRPDCAELGRAAHATAPLELSLSPHPADSVLAASRDPRLPALGWRLLLAESADPLTLLPTAAVGAEDSALLRCQLGVTEGATEIPHAGCTPLEFNCDYLHGVSFHKGCYIGQELTARTYHTGVVRKRVMPVKFSEPPPAGAVGAAVTDTASGKAVGKILSVCGARGLGLMRISESLAAGKMLLKETECEVTTEKPSWWPVQAAKERQG